jgi:hypothetical protein
MRSSALHLSRFLSQAALLSLLLAGGSRATHDGDDGDDMTVPTSVAAGDTVMATMSATLVDQNINLNSYLQVYLAASYEKADLLGALKGSKGWQPQCESLVGFESSS